MKEDRPKKILIMSDDEVLQEFENAYIEKFDTSTDNQLVISYNDKSVMLETTINLDADIITRVCILED